ncbi:hypothetical protein [Sphingomonas sp.]|uniref:hypothetical protein n=1 Tax=Sphingomonas sp. TaxID=28214 RepID=UPI003CC53014
MATDNARSQRTPPVGIDHPVQWVVCIATALFAAVALIDFPHLDAPGAPAGLLYLATAAVLVAAALNFPPLFFRMPHVARWLSFGAVLGAAALISTAHAQVAAAWTRTTQGAAEAVLQATVEAQAKAAAAQQASADRARTAGDAAAALEARKPHLCQTLVGQVVDGKRVVEINNVTVAPSVQPNEVLTCTGDAITSQGNRRIEYGLVLTPQGRQLVSTRFP